jgi:hypothetical protein
VTERNLNFNHLTSRHSRRSNTHWHFGRFWRRMMGRRLSCCVKAFLGNDPTQPNPGWWCAFASSRVTWMNSNSPDPGLLYISCCDAILLPNIGIACPRLHPVIPFPSSSPNHYNSTHMFL